MTMLHRLKPMKDRPTKWPLAQLQEVFLAHVLPRVREHATISFRFLRCPHGRADAISECEGLAWKWHLDLARRGKDASAFVSLLATYAVRHVKAGRNLVGSESGKDAMSRRAQRRRGFRVERLPYSTSCSHDRLYGEPHGQQEQDAFEERLRDNMVTPVPDQAAFRIDTPCWLRTLGGRNRGIARAMMLNHTTRALARKFGISQGRISQLRREFFKDYQRFHGEG